MWSPRKAAVMWFVLVFGSLLVIGVTTSDNPERFGRTYGVIGFIAPVIAYTLQQWRIDVAQRPKNK
jgi:hypothetical protein